MILDHLTNVHDETFQFQMSIFHINSQRKVPGIIELPPPHQYHRSFISLQSMHIDFFLQGSFQNMCTLDCFHVTIACI